MKFLLLDYTIYNHGVLYVFSDALEFNKACHYMPSVKFMYSVVDLLYCKEFHKYSCIIVDDKTFNDRINQLDSKYDLIFIDSYDDFLKLNDSNFA